MKILVFDTETNDGAKNYKVSARDDLNNYPYILQLAAKLVEVNSLNIEDSNTILDFNSYVIPIRNDQLIHLSQDAYNVHGISLSTCQERGNTITEVIIMLQGMISMADVVICHNVNFDKNVVVSEALRLGLDIRLKPSTKVWCSMLNTVDMVSIPNPRMYGTNKWPKLEELYKHLFNKSLHDDYQAHDAMGDVEATTACVLELLKRNPNLL